VVEHSAIQAHLGNGLGFGKVEVDRVAARGLQAPCMEQGRRDTDQACGGRTSVDGQVVLVEVKAALACIKNGSGPGSTR
jgi:hypothetical protein